MKDKHFRTEFGNDWRKFRDILKETSSQVVETFRETSLEDNISQWYEWAIPQSRESPINFLLRNMRHSYATTSPHNSAELEASNVIAQLGWYMGKVPFLKKVIRLNEASTELYLGQETRGYVSDEKMEEGKGCGNDHLKIITSNFIKQDLNIDVGFTNPNSPKNGRNWFYQINVFDDSLIAPSQKAHEILQLYTIVYNIKKRR